MGIRLYMQHKSYISRKDQASSQMVRSKEHLDCESEEKSEFKEHLKHYLQWENVSNLEYFEILKKCQIDQEAKIN